MSDFKIRLVNEMHELQIKLVKLSAFLVSPESNKLDVADKQLLQVQKGIMESYIQVLSIRIERSK